MADLVDMVVAGATERDSTAMSGHSLVISISIAVGVTLMQVLVFCFARPRFPAIYAPKCLGISEPHIRPINHGFFSWVMATYRQNLLDEPEVVKLEAYFFLRYLRFLIVMFMGLSLLFVPVLLPLHVKGSQHGKVAGLDSFTIANVCAEKSGYYTGHLTLCFLCLMFCLVIFRHELVEYYEIRSKQAQKRDTYAMKTMLIRNLPTALDSEDAIRAYFGMLGESIRQVHFNHRCHDLERIVQRRKNIQNKLEVLLVRLIQMCQQREVRQQALPTPPGKLWGRYLVPAKVPLTGFLKRKSMWYLKSELSRLNVQVDLLTAMPSQFSKYRSCFVEFDNREACFLAARSINLYDLHVNVQLEIFVDMVPSDIVWANVGVSGRRYKAILILATVLDYAVIFGWAIPISFVSAITQVEFLIKTSTSLSWLVTFPGAARLLNNVISPLLLSWLTSQVPALFSYLAYWKGYPSNSSVELDVQKYLFLFMFVQLFLVVVLASGIPTILITWLYNTGDGAITFANSLPRATNFFMSYLITSSLTSAGNSLLQIGRMANRLWSTLWLNTPRQVLKSKLIDQRISLGRIYPLATNIAVIAISYALVSPLILVAATVGMASMYLAFKYQMIYCADTSSTSNGKFHRRAIFQLFLGIYCLELSLLGTLLVVGKSIHLVITLILIFATVSQQHRLNRFAQDMETRITLVAADQEVSYEQVPTLGTGQPSINGTQGETWFSARELPFLDPAGTSDRDRDGHYINPCLRNPKSIVWIPSDVRGIAQDQVFDMREHFSGLLATSHGAKLTKDGKVTIDMKDLPVGFEI